MSNISFNVAQSNGSHVDNSSNDVDGGAPQHGYYRQQSDNIWTYIPPIIIVWGTMGNMLTIIILLRQFHRLSSTAMYLVVLGVSDLMTLWLGPLRQWIIQLRHEDIRKMTVAGCKIQTFLTYTTVQVSSWLLAAVTMERTLSVAAPHKVKIISTPRRAGVVITVIISALVALNGHYLWGLDSNVYVHSIGRTFDCIGKTENYQSFLINIWPWMDLVAAFLAPFAIMLVGNVTIITVLSRSRHIRRGMSQSGPVIFSERENRTLTFMLVTLCVVFVVCMTPVSVYYIFLPTVEKKVLASTDPIEEQEIIEFYYYFLSAIMNNVAYINASFNFIFYVLSGSKFRNELKLLLTCRAAPSDGAFGSSSASRGGRIQSGASGNTSTTSMDTVSSSLDMINHDFKH